MDQRVRVLCDPATSLHLPEALRTPCSGALLTAGEAVAGLAFQEPPEEITVADDDLVPLSPPLRSHHCRA
ncbi:MAG: hypothetical protein ACOC0O_03245 [Spirochaetota bacterium]